MLIAEDLLLLLTDDDTGKAAGSTHVDLGLAGALVADLALVGRVDLAALGQPVKKGRLVVKGSAPTDGASPELVDELLGHALATLASFDGKRPDKAVEALTKDIRRQLYGRLAERGLVRQHDSKLFGITLRTTWPAAERTHEQLLRANLALAVASDRELPERDAALLSILAAVGRLDVVAGAQTALMRRDIRRKNREMSSKWWVSDAVREAVKRANSRNSAVAAGAASTAVVASS